MISIGQQQICREKLNKSQLTHESTEASQKVLTKQKM